MVQTGGLRRSGRLVGLENVQCVGREKDGSMTIGLKIYTDIVVLGGMVEVLYAGCNTFYRKSL